MNNPIIFDRGAATATTATPLNSVGTEALLNCLEDRLSALRDSLNGLRDSLSTVTVSLAENEIPEKSPDKAPVLSVLNSRLMNACIFTEKLHASAVQLACSLQLH